MPGPSSRAMMRMPSLFPSWICLRTISPSPAYWRMLRAASEMAVAMKICSLLVKPISAASARPSCLAVTISASLLIGRTASSSSMPAAAFCLLVQIDQPLFQVKGRRRIFQRDPKLDHIKGNIRLDAYDDRFRAAQSKHLDDSPQGADRERVDHVEHSDIDHDTQRALLAHAGGQFVAQLDEVLIRQRGLDRRDQIVALFQNWDLHRSTALVISFDLLRTAPPCNPASFPPFRCLPAGRRQSPSYPDRRR